MLRKIQGNWQSKSGQVAVLLICLGLFAYFLFHIRQGRHGWEAQSRLISSSTLLDFEIRSLQAVSARLKTDIAALQSEPPGSDIVEEFARQNLGYAHPNDRLFKIKNE